MMWWKTVPPIYTDSVQHSSLVVPCCTYSKVSAIRSPLTVVANFPLQVLQRGFPFQQQDLPVNKISIIICQITSCSSAGIYLSTHKGQYVSALSSALHLPNLGAYKPLFSKHSCCPRLSSTVPYSSLNGLCHCSGHQWSFMAYHISYWQHSVFRIPTVPRQKSTRNTDSQIFPETCSLLGEVKSKKKTTLKKSN